MDHFWRMRSHVDMRALAPEVKARVLPYIQQWADSAAGMTGDVTMNDQAGYYNDRSVHA